MERFQGWCGFFILILGWGWPLDCAALDPDEVLVIANRNCPAGVGLARYYMQKRKIPNEHLVLLTVANNEICSRDDYNKKIADPVRRYLKTTDPKKMIRCLVTVYGVPLKIRPPIMAALEKKTAARLRNRRKVLKKELAALDRDKPMRVEKIKNEIALVNRRLNALAQKNQGASVDSELALVSAGRYDLSGWVANPYFLGFKNKALSVDQKDVKLVSRLDGPTPKVVRRIVNDSFNIEKKGLSGTAYFDARWAEPETKKLNGYALYDKSIHRGAARIKSSGKLTVVVNDKAELFKVGQAPNAALYCGWYSLGRYVDAFQWQAGAVGYHIASSECRTLKQKESQVWCKRMLEEGVAATIGPTSEPYVQAFPLPEIFFGFLVEGRLTLAECYAASLPFLSWQMVLIGDPLYRPFQHNR